MPTPADLWGFLLWGYLATIALETPVLLLGLSARHSWKRRLAAGVWLTACTYPIVVLTLPLLIAPIGGWTAYVAVAEVFAPAAECLLFWLAYSDVPGKHDSASRRSWARDFAAIVLANLISFLLGLVIFPGG